MMAKRVIPCLDVHDGQVTRGVQFGVAEKGGLKNVGDPVELALRYNDTENNVALWEFHGGIRRNLRFSDREKPFPLDRNAWHELKLAVDGAGIKGWLDGTLAIEYTLGVDPVAGRKGPPNPDLFPANNPVLRPPVTGKVGLWSKTDSTSYFKDYVIIPKPAN